MNKSYKLALVSAAVLCVVVILYYLTLDGSDTTAPAGSDGDTPIVDASDRAPQPGVAPTDIGALTGEATGSDERRPGVNDLRLRIDRIQNAAGTNTRSVTAATGTTGTADQGPTTLTLGGRTATPGPTTDTTGTTAPPSATTLTAPRRSTRSILPTARREITMANAMPPTAETVATSDQFIRIGTVTLRRTLKTYTIKGGDTFSSIAVALYGSERWWVDIAQVNPTVDPTRLKVGQMIKLPDRRDLDAADEPALPAPSATVTYTIRSRDTLSSIAGHYYNDPSLWRVIYNANRRTIGPDPDRLKPGDKIKVPPAPVGAR
ncbi:MAG: LysM peptidoglycan-binding domain-containing protein [Phycisphaeraceae bacterium]